MDSHITTELDEDFSDYKQNERNETRNTDLDESTQNNTRKFKKFSHNSFSSKNQLSHNFRLYTKTRDSQPNNSSKLAEL